MLKRLIVCSVLAASAFTGVSSALPAPADAAPKCADVHVLFARGTAETAPPLGVTGIAFERSVRAALPGKRVRVEAVSYRASSDFRDKLAFAHTFINGVKSAQSRIKQIAAACPSTDIVVGGYSQGAALAAYAVADDVRMPPSYAAYQRYTPKPLPASIAPHVKAVVLFGPPSDRFLRDAKAPTMHVGRAYRGKTVRYCAAGDTICNGARLGGPNAMHLLYPVNGMTDAGARYVARRV
ncbi:MULTISPECIES: cutinase family protein [unclassified Gordonia (in: high G+C Gram-positive bacteria)]|uniref:cutinase family protein n=1 Tax=unclassified Gordonia (in: high G+C Gram-positive bacteria) TaxID=2657482 RepID=UPI001F06E2FA|nr:cutinase family protein [Gordonia sp. PDNC005]